MLCSSRIAKLSANVGVATVAPTAPMRSMSFSCKRRGFCPSCGARRIAETAAHLVDHVIARVPVRQWVLSFPIPLGLLFAADPELPAPVLQIIHWVISALLIQQAPLTHPSDTGAVRLIQRFASAANLNIHLHCPVLNGVYRAIGDVVLLWLTYEIDSGFLCDDTAEHPSVCASAP